MRMRGVGLAVLAVGMLAAPMPARAQLGVYGEFTGANPRLANEPNIYGGTFGFYTTKRLGLVAVGPDLRGTILRRGSSTPDSDQVLDMGMGGLRLAITPHVLPLMPYVEGMAGLAYSREGAGAARQDFTKFAAEMLAGVDYTLVPRVDWRVVEFSFGKVGTHVGAYHPETLSTGVVLRLP